VTAWANKGRRSSATRAFAGIWSSVAEDRRRATAVKCRRLDIQVKLADKPGNGKPGVPFDRDAGVRPNAAVASGDCQTFRLKPRSGFLGRSEPNRDALMAKPPLYRWTIYLIRKRGELLGSVEAPDEKTAIAAAIEKYGITDSEQQKRLIAQRQRVQHY
jgi:hypothetical protein